MTAALSRPSSKCPYRSPSREPTECAGIISASLADEGIAIVKEKHESAPVELDYTFA
jgi:hypothetical protein